MIDAQEVWPLFLQEARIYEENEEIYLSPSEGGSYQITNTNNDIIYISRINIPGSGETLSIRKFDTAISRINDQNPIFPKGRVYEHVAEEVTIVELLPFLDWSENGRNIVNTHKQFEINLNEDNNEAQNDDINNRVVVTVRQRKGQRKFREKLLKIYEGKCVFSNCSIKEVLHACHINPHSISGINLSSNGLILRSDLHDLFDQNLIAIAPNDFTIRVSNKLLNTDYYIFNNKKIKHRNDDKLPDEEGLIRRWQEFIV